MPSQLLRRSHASGFNKIFSRVVDVAAGSAARSVDIESGGLGDRLFAGCWQRWRQRYLVADWPGVIGEKFLELEGSIVAQHSAHEVGLSAHEKTERDLHDGWRGAPAQVLAIKHTLRVEQLTIENRQRQLGGQHCVLNVEQPIVARVQTTLIGDPAFGTRIGSVDADVYDFRDLETPFPQRGEALLVPVWLGNQ